MTDAVIDLPAILAAHAKWLAGDGGSRANLAGADLSRANWAGANLYGADLRGVNLAGANLICGGGRSDGYFFYLIKELSGALMLRVGCRYLSIADARAYWMKTQGDTDLGRESQALIDHLEIMAKIKGWMK